MRLVKKNERDFSKSAYQLKIELKDIKPIVWRRVLVLGKYNLKKLHDIIQLTMGWTDSHLHEFLIENRRYINPDYDEDDFNEGEPALNEKKTKICDILSFSDTFQYSYDFGDGWEHFITVEEIVDMDEVNSYPLCIGGENACPPEDCGGVSGYERLKEEIKDENDEEGRSKLMWVGGYFNPYSFDANRINRDFLWRKRF